MAEMSAFDCRDLSCVDLPHVEIDMEVDTPPIIDPLGDEDEEFELIAFHNDRREDISDIKFSPDPMGRNLVCNVVLLSTVL